MSVSKYVGIILSFVFSKVAATRQVRFAVLSHFNERITAMFCELCQHIGHKFYNAGSSRFTSVRPSTLTLDKANALSLILEWACGCAELPVAAILAVIFGLRD